MPRPARCARCAPWARGSVLSLRLPPSLASPRSRPRQINDRGLKRFTVTFPLVATARHPNRERSGTPYTRGAMLWLKAFHIVFVVTWFAGLFYLPRLFVYHVAAAEAASRER